jgi:hypothetical protein
MDSQFFCCCLRLNSSKRLSLVGFIEVVLGFAGIFLASFALSSLFTVESGKILSDGSHNYDGIHLSALPSRIATMIGDFSTPSSNASNTSSSTLSIENRLPPKVYGSNKITDDLLTH